MKCQTMVAGIGNNFSNFQTDATINYGNSGGPILTQKGNVKGVAVQLIPPDKAQNIFFGVKSSYKPFSNLDSYSRAHLTASVLSLKCFPK